MKTPHTLMIASVLLTIACLPASAQKSDLDQMKDTVKSMEQTIEQMKQKIAELEKAKAQTPTVTTTNPLEAASRSIQTLEKIAAGEQVSEKSPVTYRGTLNDPQEAASRPKDYTLDPTCQGFIPIPNTPALIKFNPKPHLDMMTDNQNTGDRFRFVPALFPLEGASNFDGGRQSSVSGNATQLRLDVRAPEMGGNFRFYYQNDFQGSDTKDMQYRLQHIYGQIYGFKGGFTYSVWEDPDSWPDTVDYEGPNAVIFARRPVAQYTYSWNQNWNTTFGVEKPDIFSDINTAGNTNSTQLNRMPDLGFNTRFEKDGFGHFQFSTIFRDLGAKDDLGETHHAFGWGVNLSANIDVTKKDYLQLLGVYGEGVAGMGNDTSFLNSDAAFSSSSSFEALPYWSATAGFTHRWSEQFRSTITYGYVNLDNTAGQTATFYHTSHYASANLIWQLRKRLSVGLEGLYGFKEAQNGADSGDLWRVQLGMVYSLFD
jgi:hypothetical protein